MILADCRCKVSCMVAAWMLFGINPFSIKPIFSKKKKKKLKNFIATLVFMLEINLVFFFYLFIFFFFANRLNFFIEP